MPLFVQRHLLAYQFSTLEGREFRTRNMHMEIYHWWLIKMVAIQLLCLLGVAWGVRYLWHRRCATAKIQKTSSASTPGQP